MSTSAIQTNIKNPKILKGSTFTGGLLDKWFSF